MSLMKLAGKANWWLPGYLGRILPRVRVDRLEAVLGAKKRLTSRGTVSTEPGPVRDPSGKLGSNALGTGQLVQQTRRPGR